MGSGAFSKAAKRINYDLGFSKLRDALLQAEKEREQEQIYNTLKETFGNSVEDINQASAPELTGEVTNPFAPTNITGNLSSQPLGSSLAGLQPSQNILAGGDLPKNNIVIPEAQTRQPTQEEVYQRGTDALQGFENTLAPTQMNRFYDKDIATKAALMDKILQDRVNSLKPKEQEEASLKGFDPFKNVFDEKTKELVYKAKEKPQKQTKKYYPDIYETPFDVEIDGVPYKKAYNKKTGKYEILGKSTKKKTGGGKGYDENGLPDVSKQYGTVNEGLKKITDLDNNKTILGRELGMVGNDANNFIDLKDSDYKAQRDLIKEKYVAPLQELVDKRDLNEAIESLKRNYKEAMIKSIKEKNPDAIISPNDERFILKDPKVIKETIKKFLKHNPDYKAEKKYLELYFKFNNL